jgi:D-alanyl-D-alanine carboxypeptidase (penicillin-binding protein 5/6)
MSRSPDLPAGARYSVADLLRAMLLPSGNDVANTLAIDVGHGSMAHFLALMNAAAKQLGLTDTHYTTPVGLDTPGNYSSAANLATLAAGSAARPVLRQGRPRAGGLPAGRPRGAEHRRS